VRGSIELCCNCDDPTGKGGKADDSLYIGAKGPLCQDCFDNLSPAPVRDAAESALDKFVNCDHGQTCRAVDHEDGARAELPTLRARVAGLEAQLSEHKRSIGVLERDRDAARALLAVEREKAIADAVRVAEATAEAMGKIGPLGYAGSMEAAHRIRALAQPRAERETTTEAGGG
jgi:hypothetical protein